MRRIIVINPNSTQAVTQEIDRAVEPLRLLEGPAIECVTLKDGPPGIESQLDADKVILPLSNYIRSRESDGNAFVIACFGDPGLHSARQVTAKPVFGIGECAMATALTRADRFGIISILQDAIGRHRRTVRAAGLESRFAGDLAIDVGIQGLGDEAMVLERMIGVGNRLRKDFDAGVLIMGCAGMARHREPLEKATGLPVIEPTHAAVTMALGAILIPQ